MSMQISEISATFSERCFHSLPENKYNKFTFENGGKIWLAMGASMFRNGQNPRKRKVEFAVSESASCMQLVYSTWLISHQKTLPERQDIGTAGL